MSILSFKNLTAPFTNKINIIVISGVTCLFLLFRGVYAYLNTNISAQNHSSSGTSSSYIPSKSSQPSVSDSISRKENSSPGIDNLQKDGIYNHNLDAYDKASEKPRNSRAENNDKGDLIENRRVFLEDLQDSSQKSGRPTPTKIPSDLEDIERTLGLRR